MLFYRILLATFVFLPLSSAAQFQSGRANEPVMDDSGRIYLPGLSLDSESYSQLRDFGAGGSLLNEEVCALVDAQLPGKLVESLGGVALGIGSLFGICPSKSKLFAEAAESYNKSAKALCERFNGLAVVDMISHGEAYTAIQSRLCTYSAQEIESCDDALDLCRRSEIEGAVFSSGDDSRGGTIAGSFLIPGCECSVFYMIPPLT